MAASEVNFFLDFTYYSYFLLTLVSFVCVLLLWRARKPSRKLPPGPWSPPIVGYLPFLGKEPFRTLNNFSEKYGNVFSLYMGRTYVVILGDYTAVKEAFSKWETTDRPPELFSFLPDGVGFSSVNGQEWVEQRRFSVKVMRDLGLGKSGWVHLVEDEVSDFVQMVQSYNGQPMDIFKFLTSSISNNIASLVFGKRLPFGDPKREFLDQCLDDVMQCFTQAGFGNYFPWLVKIMVKFNIGGYDKSFEVVKAFNNYMRKEIGLHKTRDSTLTNDFIYFYLQEMEEQKKRNANTTFNESNLVGNTQALFLGGSDTTRTSLHWIIIAMTTYPDVQKKVHIELDSVLEVGRSASWQDRSNLPYTYAAMMEGQRWKTIAPLNTSRVAREDIKVCGFDIPKGSTIIANNWGINNDQRYWKEPEEFIPERFLQNEGRDVNLRPESYVPFSYGKRNCPGETVAMMEIFLYFTALMQLFEVRTPNGEKPCLDAVLGLTYQPIPQKFCFIPRSPKSQQK